MPITVTSASTTPPGQRVPPGPTTWSPLGNIREFASDVLGFHAVRSYVWGPNTRSAAALRKQGYQDAGIFHWSGIKNGELSFDVTFDLLAEEWRAMRDAANG